MLNKSVLALFVTSLFLTSLVYAQQEAGLEVAEMEFCTSVENRGPAGVDKIFPDTVEKVYCFTRITGAADTTTVSHVWFFNDEEKAKVELAVRSESWRTWSSKRIMKGWDGKWRVDVLSSDGKLLISKEFLVKPTTE